MRLLKAIAIVTGMAPAIVNAENQALSKLVQDDQSFELMRNMTDVINPAILRYLIQLELDTNRIEFLYRIDRSDATIVKFQLDSKRSSDFGQGLLAELAANQIPQPLVEEAVLGIWQVVSLSNECSSQVSCENSDSVQNHIDDVIQDLFPELISPESGGTAEEIPPPNPKDIGDIIRWVFETNQCTASETQIYDAISSRTDLWTANQAIRFWTEGNDFSDNFERLAGGPPDYRMFGTPLCPRQNTLEKPLSNAAKYLIDERVSYACSNKGGSYSPKGIIIADLDGDDREDLILDDGWIVCEGTPQGSITCGVRACEIAIYLRRGNILKPEVEYLGVGAKVDNGAFPTISGQASDLTPYNFGWDGQKFVSR